MRTIHKFDLKDPLPYKMSLTWLNNPIINILAAGIQGDGENRLKMWAEVVETSVNLEPRLILLAGTGADLTQVHPAAKRFLGTVMDGCYVWHAFDLTGSPKVLSRIYADYLKAIEPKVAQEAK